MLLFRDSFTTAGRDYGDYGALNMQKQFVSVHDNAGWEQVKERHFSATATIPRPGIVLAVESIARNPINATRCARASERASGERANRRIDRAERGVPL
jgi:hypothetical protein